MIACTAAGGKPMTMKRFVITNIVLGLMFVNVALFGRALRMGESFTAGLTVGIAAGWLIFITFGLVSMKRGGRNPDERQLAIMTRAASLAFWILVMTLSLATAAFRSEVLGIRLESRDLLPLFSNFGLLVFGLTWFVLSRRG